MDCAHHIYTHITISFTCLKYLHKSSGLYFYYEAGCEDFQDNTTINVWGYSLPCTTLGL